MNYLSNFHFIQKILLLTFAILALASCNDFHELVYGESEAPNTPNAPTLNVKSDTEIDLKWSTVEEAASYMVLRSKTNNTNDAQEISTVTTTQFSDTNLIQNTTYYYWLKACDGKCSGFSDEASATTRISSPDAPSSTGYSNSHIDITWSSVPGAVSYQVYQSATNDTSGLSPISTVASTSYSDTGLTDNTTYYYWLKACSANNYCTDFSPVFTTRTAPNAPTLTTTASQNNIILNWSTISNINYYQIYRHTSSAINAATKIAEPNAGETSYKDTSNTTNTIYYYWLKACTTGNVCSEPSSTAEGIIAEIKLNDTGVNFGGNKSTNGNQVTCNSDIVNGNQDCHQGRDASAQASTLVKTGYGAVGFDFTKLADDGTSLAIQTQAWNPAAGTEAAGTKWSCVRDSHTNLIWEVKTDDSGIHDKDNTYKWGGLTAMGKDHASKEGTYYSDWDTLVNGANTATYGGNTGLCGFTDWRVPSKNDLASIVNLSSQPAPAIDTNYFPNTVSAVYWSATPDAISSTKAGAIDFTDGSGPGINETESRATSTQVRLVRGGIPIYAISNAPATAVSGQTVKNYIPNIWPDDRYQVDTTVGSETVIDTYTNLMWKACPEGRTYASAPTPSCTGTATRTWKESLEAAKDSVWAGHSDWRLPNAKELRTLIAFDRYNPQTNLSIFPNGSSWYWSSTPFKNTSWTFALLTDTDGSFGPYARGNYMATILVRDLP